LPAANQFRLPEHPSPVSHKTGTETNMKNFIAISAAALTAAAANASVTSFNSLATWAAAAPSPTTTPAGYTDPGTFSNGVQVNATTVTAGLGWEQFTASIIGGTLTVDTVNNTLSIAAGSTGAATVTWTFDHQYLPPYTAGGDGIWAIAFNFSSLSNGNVGMESNGVPVNGVGPYTTFIGATINAANVPTGTAIAPFSTFSLTFAANSTAVINGSYYGIVPAPGALALLGVAGMIGSRRRS
jgi:hypothetical protein